MCYLLVHVCTRSGSATAMRFPQGRLMLAIVLNGGAGTDEHRVEKTM